MEALFELLRDADEGPPLLAVLSGSTDPDALGRYRDLVLSRGGPRAALLRLVARLPSADPAARAALLAEAAGLEAELDPAWVALVVREGRIGNCGGAAAAAAGPPELRFAYACPRSWERLEATADPAVRRCDACEREVFWCESFEAAERRALEGACISVPGRLVAQAHERFAGRVTGRPDALALWGRRVLG
jgi:hypothetical protein